VNKRVFLTLLAAAGLMLACSSKEERVARHLDRAAEYLEDATWAPDQALIELQAALDLDPQRAETNYRMGELLEREERWEDALFYYEEARRLDPSRDDAALAVAHLVRISEPDRGEKLIDEVLARNPSSPLAHVLRSDVYLVRNDPKNALASALTAAELDPKSTRAALQVAAVRKTFIRERLTKKESVDPKLYEEADAALARAIEIGKATNDIVWFVRAVGERAQVLTAWHGHGPEVVKLFHDADAFLKDYPRLQIKIAQGARVHGRAARDQELVHWALSRLVELDPGDHESWVELAELATKRGEDGVAVMQRLVKERPDDPRAHLGYADYLASHGKYAEAVAHLESVLAGSRAPDALLAALVSHQLAAGDPIRATQALERLRSEHPDSPKTQQAEAMLANYEGRVRDAIAALEKWISQEETPTAFAMLSDARLRSGNPRDALDAIDRALALAGGPRPPYQRLRGRILVKLGDFRGALRAFSRARDAGGPIPIPFVPDLARALYEVGKPAEARMALDRALGEERPPALALLLFARAEAERDPKGARTALERGAALYPEELQFEAMLTTAELRAGQQDAALERALRSVEAHPDAPITQTVLAQVLLNMGKNDEAVQQVEMIQQRWPDQPGIAELYLNVMTRAGRGEQAFESLSREHEAGRLAPHGRVLLARLHSARGEEDEAIELLRSALEQTRDLPAAENDLAYLLARRGEQLQEATELAQDARANRPDSSEIADTLGYVYLRRELGEAALVQFEAALELAEAGSSSWATAQYHRGLALRLLGREPEAVTALEQALASGADFAEVKEANQALAELAKSAAAARTAAEGS